MRGEAILRQLRLATVRGMREIASSLRSSQRQHVGRRDFPVATARKVRDLPHMKETLYAPWRQEFILGAKKKSDEDGCIFCDPDSRKDVRELIVHRGKTAYVVMNRYPYNAGHLLVIPFRHVAQLHDLKSSERREIMDLVALSSDVLTDVQKPAGMNIGMNLGRAAGAGIDGHLHVHLVPRWVGDNNFMPAIFETRIISVDLRVVYRKLKAAFAKRAR